MAYAEAIEELLKTEMDLDLQHACGLDYLFKVCFPIRGTSMATHCVMWCAKCGRIIAGSYFGIQPGTELPNVRLYFDNAQDEVNREVDTQVFLQRRIDELEWVEENARKELSNAKSVIARLREDLDDVKVALEVEREAHNETRGYRQKAEQERDQYKRLFEEEAAHAQAAKENLEREVGNLQQKNNDLQRLLSER